tara:strand:- start:202 stop:540 length:339 start_codon:yes stop_codon:yes gene_type:complete
MPNPHKPIYQRGRKIKPETRRAQIPGTDLDYPDSSKVGLTKKLIKLAANKIMKKSSWKTTLGGLLMAGGPALKGMLPAQWDWIGDALLAIGGLIVGASARDNNVSSEDAGAK